MKLRSVDAVFKTGRSTIYSYLVPDGDEPKVGDLIVTSILWAPNNDYDHSFIKEVIDNAHVARITDVSLPGYANSKAKKFYLALVDRDGMKERFEANKRQVEVARLREDARRALDALLEERGRVMLYEKLAEADPEARKLLAVLRGEAA